MELTIGVLLLFSRCHLRGIYAVVWFHNYCMTLHTISKGLCQKPGACQSKGQDHRAKCCFIFRLQKYLINIHVIWTNWLWEFALSSTPFHYHINKRLCMVLIHTMYFPGVQSSLNQQRILFHVFAISVPTTSSRADAPGVFYLHHLHLSPYISHILHLSASYLFSQIFYV